MKLLSNEAGGFNLFIPLIFLGLLAGVTTILIDTAKEGINNEALKDYQQQVIRPMMEQESPNQPATQEQASPVNPRIFPKGTADPYKQQPQQQPVRPPEPGLSENQGGGPIQMCYKQEIEYGHTGPDGTKVRDGTYWKCLSPQMDPAICPHADLH